MLTGELDNRNTIRSISKQSMLNHLVRASKHSVGLSTVGS